MINIIITALCVLSLALSGKPEYAVIFNLSNVLLTATVVLKTLMFIAILSKKEKFDLNLGKRTITFKLLSKMDSEKERTLECRLSISLALVGVFMVCGPHMIVGVLLAASSLFMVIKLMEFEKKLAK